MTHEEITLEIPGSADYLRLARLAVADAGARVGFTFEDIDDLRIAVDELCFALGNGNAGGRLRLLYRVSDDRIEVEGHCDRAGPVAPPSELASAILAAVIDEYTLTEADGGAHFRFVKVLPRE